MPIYLRTSGYKIYIWSNERDEPVHFHIAKGNPSDNDTKIWVLSNLSFMIAHNKSRIPEKELTKIFLLMQTYIMDFLQFWRSFYGDSLRFYE